MSTVDPTQTITDPSFGNNRLSEDVWSWLSTMGSALSVDDIKQSVWLDTQQLLVRLGSDQSLLDAALLFDWLHEFDGSGEIVDWSQAPVSDVLLRLLDGQRQADQVWSIHADAERQGSEGLRRLLLALVGDLRVVPILIARQLARMRAATQADEVQQKKLGQLTRDIHAPLANRLGIWQLKWELEDLAFRFLEPNQYKRIAKLLAERRADREDYLEETKNTLSDAMQAAGIEAEVSGRPKHIYSIHKKMLKKNLPFSDLFDIRAVRIMVHDLAACYAALGVVHQIWTPIPSEFDDYIARPKDNNYRSLHTAVLGPKGQTVEVQIRTFEMHEFAELGVAAHWRYKEGGRGDEQFEKKIAWMRQLLDQSDDQALASAFSHELVEERVYVLTPQGDVIDLTMDATVLDFAYQVHTQVGHRCIGAKVNGRIVPLTHTLQSGDRVEILTGKEVAPRRDWLMPQLGYLKSTRARQKVRAFFNRIDAEQNAEAGRELIEKEFRKVGVSLDRMSHAAARLRVDHVTALYVAAALGEISLANIVRAARPAEERADPKPSTVTPVDVPNQTQTSPSTTSSDIITIGGVGNVASMLAKCCAPVRGDPVAGYLTQSRGISVHRQSCSTLARLVEAHPERLMDVAWGDSHRNERYDVPLRVLAQDRPKLMKHLVDAVSMAKVGVSAFRQMPVQHDGSTQVLLRVRVLDDGELSDVMSKLSMQSGVFDVQREQG